MNRKQQNDKLREQYRTMKVYRSRHTKCSWCNKEKQDKRKISPYCSDECKAKGRAYLKIPVWLNIEELEERK